MSLVFDLKHQTLILEGQAYKIGKKLDVALDLNEYCRLKKELHQIEIKKQQYIGMINEFEKQAMISKAAKRRGMR